MRIGHLPLLALVIVGSCLWALPAPADTRPVPFTECDRETRIDMMRIRVAELGQRLDRRRTREGDALWWILVRRRAERLGLGTETTYRDTLHAYAGRRLQRPNNARLKEISQLDADEPRLKAIVDRAGAWCDGKVPNPCPSCIHWGMKEPGSIDMRRAKRKRWRRARFGWHLAFWLPA